MTFFYSDNHVGGSVGLLISLLFLVCGVLILILNVKRSCLTSIKVIGVCICLVGLFGGVAALVHLCHTEEVVQPFTEHFLEEYDVVDLEDGNEKKIDVDLCNRKPTEETADKNIGIP